MSNIYAKDPEASTCGVDDMTKLAYLHEPGVLQNLKSRYDMNEIYVSDNLKSKIKCNGFFSFSCIGIIIFMGLIA